MVTIIMGFVTQQAKSVSLGMAEVVAAVQSLYIDDLKPYGRIVRKRLEESAAQAFDIDMRKLRSQCEQCPLLTVGSEEEGGDWFVLLQNRPAAFVDVYSPEDTYPPQLWFDAARYFEGLGEADMVLPGGRYSCAQVLRERRLSFLEGRSLGQICHIVQLGISQKKLLGYLHGAVVPYTRSQTMLKDTCARRQRPCTGGDKGGLATWEEVRKCLQEVIRGLNPDSSLPLSNMKRLFRSRFGKTLSETALGHAKLSELFQDYRLCDLCTVRLQGQGYVLTPLPQKPSARQAVFLAEQVPAMHMIAAPFDGHCVQPGWMPFADHAFVPQSFPAPDYAMGSIAMQFPAETLQQQQEQQQEQQQQPQKELDGALPVLLGFVAPPIPAECSAVHGRGIKEAGGRASMPEAAQTKVDRQAVQTVSVPGHVTSMEIQVKNTFINVVVPLASATRRTQSCPRNI